MAHYSSLEDRDNLKQSKKGKNGLEEVNIHDQQSKETKDTKEPMGLRWSRIKLRLKDFAYQFEIIVFIYHQLIFTEILIILTIKK